MGDESSQLPPKAGNLELDRLRRLAADEAIVNRTELEHLNEAALDLVGEVRYHVLWRLNQLQRLCSALERPLAGFTDWEELSRARQELSSQTLNAVNLRQEAKLLMNACRAPARASAKRTCLTQSSRFKAQIRREPASKLQEPVMK